MLQAHKNMQSQRQRLLRCPCYDLPLPFIVQAHATMQSQHQRPFEDQQQLS